MAVSEGQWGHVSQVWHEYGCSEMWLMKEYSSDLHIRSLRGKEKSRPQIQSVIARSEMKLG